MRPYATYQIRNICETHPQKTQKNNQTNTPPKNPHEFPFIQYYIPDYLLAKLQGVKNNAASCVIKQRKSCHIKLILSDLHFLPVSFKIKYKILLLVFKCLHGQGPVYLTLLLKEYFPPRSLRSLNQFSVKIRGVTIHFPNDPIRYTIQSKRYDMYCDTLSEFINQKNQRLY